MVAGYGDIEVLQGLDMNVKDSEAVAIVGMNGSGKTTILKSIVGLLKPKRGTVVFDGENITALKPSKILVKGIAFVPQGRNVFTGLTVYENLEMSLYSLKNAKHVFSERVNNVFQLFPALKDKSNDKAETLSGGQRQMLALARALMLEPKLLLLDEPSLGLDPKSLSVIYSKIKELKNTGNTLLIVEQNIRKALDICDRGYVLELGSFIFEDSSKNLLRYLLQKGI